MMKCRLSNICVMKFQFEKMSRVAGMRRGSSTRQNYLTPTQYEEARLAQRTFTQKLYANLVGQGSAVMAARVRYLSPVTANILVNGVTPETFDISASDIPAFNTVVSDEVSLVAMTALETYCGPGQPCPETNLPTNFDARERWPNLISVAMDQKQCGACWAFASAQCFGDRVRIFSTEGTSSTQLTINESTPQSSSYTETIISDTQRPLLRGQSIHLGQPILETLSPYYMASCGSCELLFRLRPEVRTLLSQRNLCGSCCGGAVVLYAAIWLLFEGIISMSCDPEPEEYSCTDIRGCPRFRPKQVYKVNPNPPSRLKAGQPGMQQAINENVEAIMRELLNNGPIQCSMLVYPNFPKWPGHDQGLVYDRIEGTAMGGHCVAIIGWGIGQNQVGMDVPYWLVRNSWGPNWGVEGTFKILRGANLCLIEQDVVGVEPMQVYDLRPTPVDPNLQPAPPVKSCRNTGRGVLSVNS